MSFNNCTAVVLYNAPKTTAQFIETEAEKFQMEHFGVKFKEIDWTFANMQRLAQRPAQKFQAPTEQPQGCWVRMEKEVIPSLRGRVSEQSNQLPHYEFPTFGEMFYVQMPRNENKENLWTYTRFS